MMDKIIEKLYFLEKYGVAHGLYTAGLMFVTLLLFSWPNLSLVLGGLSCIYWYRREAEARRSWDIRTWYTDSRWDALTPIVVVLIACYITYFTNWL